MHRHKLLFYHAVADWTTGHASSSTGIIAVQRVQS